MRLVLDLDMAPLRDALDSQARRIRYVTYTTLNRAAQQAQQDIRGEMEKVFDRPTPYTLNSMRIEYAKRDSLESQVLFKDRLGSSKSNAPERWVGVQVRGGPRGMTRAERRLAFTLGLGHLYWIPTKAAERDSYGNVQRGLIIKILSALQALSGAGSDGNQVAGKRSRGKRKAEEYFAVKERRGDLAPGVYIRRQHGSVSYAEAVYYFYREPPTYQARLDFYGVARRSVTANLPRIWAEVWAAP